MEPLDEPIKVEVEPTRLEVLELEEELSELALLETLAGLETLEMADVTDELEMLDVMMVIEFDVAEELLWLVNEEVRLEEGAEDDVELGNRPVFEDVAENPVDEEVMGLGEDGPVVEIDEDEIPEETPELVIVIAMLEVLL